MQSMESLRQQLNEQVSSTQPEELYLSSVGEQDISK